MDLAPSAQTEIELVTSAKAGDRAAFGELVRRHREGVINVIYRMCGDAAVAEDAAQEAFIRAWQHLGRYRTGSSFRNWVYRIGTNAAVDALRRQRDTAELDAVHLVSSANGPEEALLKQELGDQVRRAVLALPEGSRAVLVLREYGGLSYREIAETLRIPTGTVMSRLNYARCRLRETLRPMLEAQ